MVKPFTYVALCFLLLSLQSCQPEKNSTTDDPHANWTNYAGTKSGIRYSSLEQIDLDNIQDLKVAWTYSSHDKDPENRSQNQCNPIVVEGILYGTSPGGKLFALNAASGEERWSFDPAALYLAPESQPHQNFSVIRGVVYWSNQSKTDERIFYSSGSRTYCINAKSGKLIENFGHGGSINLAENLDRDPKSYNPYVASTTPGIIFKDLLILSMRVLETADAAPGHIRAYDVRTGALQWIFHTIPHPGEVGYETWPDSTAYKKLGGANNWAGMSLDEERGIVYVPTGSVSGDFYGGIREGQNLFANSLIALEAATGKYIWHYQTVHHDLWDRDLPANPNLFTLIKDGDTLDAVAQITKQGYVFVFDRETGKPVFPIEEVPVPQNALPGEKVWPTQPIPALPEPFARQSFSLEEVQTFFPENYPELLQTYKQIKYHTPFTPPGKEGVWIFPGFDGGGEWGGAAIDPRTNVLYVNSSEIPFSMTMIEAPKDQSTGGTMKEIGQRVYNKNCIPCHGPERKGNPPVFPNLLGVDRKYTAREIKMLLQTGRNMMPAFKHLTDNEIEPLLTFILDLKDKEAPEYITNAHANSRGILEEIPYLMTGYNRFLDKNGYPGITPPWGTLNAVDLSSGRLLWKVPLGEFEALTKMGIPPTGTENYGGPVVTAGGLVFIAATQDARIRAFDKQNGKVVWEHPLPVPGYATPSVYQVEGKQYVVVACGGGKLGSPSGDQYVAFSLEDPRP